MPIVDGADAVANSQGPPYWLIVRHEDGRANVLTLDLAGRANGEDILPIFGTAEEAEAFLRSGASGWLQNDGWQAKQSGNRKLLSVLSGPCRSVKRVALDPPPGVTAEESADLVGVNREGFVEQLMGRGRSWFRDRYGRGKGTVGR